MTGPSVGQCIIEYRDQFVKPSFHLTSNNITLTIIEGDPSNQFLLVDTILTRRPIEPISTHKFLKTIEDFNKINLLDWLSMKASNNRGVLTNVTKPVPPPKGVQGSSVM